jgi:chromosome partitioning protein
MKLKHCVIRTKDKNQEDKNMAAIIISVNSNKGGVGKTTTAVVLGELLAYLGKRTTIVDHDPQGNSSMQFHLQQKDIPEVEKGFLMPEKENYHIAELYRFRYRNKEDVLRLVRETYIKNLSIIPSSRRHQNTPDILAGNTGNNNIILKRALATISDEFDYIIIDNGPANDILTVNSIFASDLVLIPVRCEEYSTEGVQETLKSIIYIKEEHDLENPKVIGSFITQANVITKAYKGSRQHFTDNMTNMFFDTAIRQDTKINDIEREFKPLLTFPSSRALNDYCSLLMEMGIIDDDTEEKLRAIMKNRA